MRFPPLRLIGLLLALAGWPVAARAAPPVWLQVKADDCVVYSDASRKDAVEFTVEFAAYRHVFKELFASPGHMPPPCILILFRRASTLRDYIPMSKDPDITTTHFSIDMDGTPLLALSLAGGRDEKFASTVEFETVWALRQIGYYMPVWMAQGAGKVLSTLEVRKGKCLVGEVEGLDTQYLRQDKSIAWPHFFEIGTGSAEYAGKKDPGVYHSQDWALMHWILLKDDKTRERFAALAVKTWDTPGLEAVQAVMGVKSDDFDRAIRKHLNHYSHHKEIAFDEAKLRAGLVIQPVPEAEILAVTAGLLEASGRLPQCDLQLDRAHRIAPDMICVKEALARRALHDNRPDDAVDLYREAIAAGTTNYTAFLVSANARLEASSVGGTDYAGGGGRGTTRALEEINRALELNPGNPEAYRVMGRAFYIMPEITEENLHQLEKGVTLGESGERVRFYLALLWQRLGRSAECRAALQQVIRDPDTSVNDRRNAQHQLAFVTAIETEKKVESLVAENNYEEARQLAAQAEAGEEDREMALRYHRLLEWVDQHKAPAPQPSGN